MATYPIPDEQWQAATQALIEKFGLDPNHVTGLQAESSAGMVEVRFEVRHRMSVEEFNDALGAHLA